MANHKQIMVGDKFTLRPSVEVTVTAYVDAKNVEVTDSEGHSRWLYADDLWAGRIKWLNRFGQPCKSKRQPFVGPPKPVRRSLSSHPVPTRHYVYIVSVNGEVVYVGKGTGLRYTHAYSGQSGNRELNRLYFQKAPAIVEVYKDNLTDAEAKHLEKQLIGRLKPKCNEVIYKVPSK